MTQRKPGRYFSFLNNCVEQLIAKHSLDTKNRNLYFLIN